VQLELHPKADGEVDATVDWYEGQRVGLGAEFFDELEDALRQIATSPHLWPVWPGARPQALGVRRFLMSRFPYALPYLVLGDTLVVLAVAHVRRRPGYWLKRARGLKRA
jgi:toxin ParE1/3/4